MNIPPAKFHGGQVVVVSGIHSVGVVEKLRWEAYTGRWVYTIAGESGQAVAFESEMRPHAPTDTRTRVELDSQQLEAIRAAAHVMGLLAAIDAKRSDAVKFQLETIIDKIKHQGG